MISFDCFCYCYVFVLVVFFLFCFFLFIVFLWLISLLFFFFFFSSRRRHTRCLSDWSQTCALPIWLRFEALEDRAVPAFLSPVDYFVGREAVVADFNNDNVQDLAVASGVLLGNGDGTFGAVIRSTFGNSPQALAVGDFNADGKLDLAAGDRSAN